MIPTPPFPNTQMGKGGKCETTNQNKGAPRSTAERHGALRNLTDRLNLAIPNLNPPYFSGPPPIMKYFMRPTPPFPNTENGKGGGDAKLPTKQRGTAERHGTPRSLTGRLYLATARWNLPYFGGFRPNYVIFFFASNTPFSQHPNGEGGGMRNYRPNKGAPMNY